MKILFINARQPVEEMSEGKLNAHIASCICVQLISKGHDIRTTEIIEGYDVEQEVEKHVWADIIITQSPVYWFGNPWTYKKYVDEVFNAGLLNPRMVANDGRTRNDPNKQYGTGGLMQGKKYMLSLTWNAPEAAFNDKDQYLFQGKTVDDVFIFNTANYKFCGAEILPSFSFHDVLKHGVTNQDMERLRAHLDAHIS
ncbi:MAG: flavodoxin family protein [Gammaproteobacteria bacterium]|nr:MAG: flavodoxin family protein [Gammaproteobacteria bacterium]